MYPIQLLHDLMYPKTYDNEWKTDVTILNAYGCGIYLAIIYTFGHPPAFVYDSLALIIYK